MIDKRTILVYAEYGLELLINELEDNIKYKQMRKEIVDKDMIQLLEIRKEELAEITELKIEAHVEKRLKDLE